MKPYNLIPIQDCREPLVEIPPQIARETPHPYLRLSAPYGDHSPYWLRQGVLDRLLLAQTKLHQMQPNWNIQIFDAYRPIAVQQYMVNYTFEQLLKSKSLTVNSLEPNQHQALLQEVYRFWAEPSLDPQTPPPHSTGAALDVTLVDHAGIPVEMGSPIDEMSPRSYPNHYVALESARTFHQNRLLLHQAMSSAGFEQHPKEWWHFSWGDQLWAWLVCQKPDSSHNTKPIAQYGGLG